MWAWTVLRMTTLFATMSPAVVEAIAKLSTVEHAKPVVAAPLFALIRARHLLLNLAAVAFRINFDWTCSTDTCMAGSLAHVLTTRQDISTYCTAAPADVVTCLDALPLCLLLPAETHLLRTNCGARRTRAGVTYQIARMRTRLGELAITATGLTTRMRW